MLSVKKRKKHHLLVDFSESKTKTIGIMGADRSIGVTTVSISLATYLAEIYHKRIAVVMYSSNRNSDSTYKKIADYSKSDMNKTGVLKEDKIDYYENICLVDIYVKEYDYIIIDYGKTSKEKIEDFVKNIYKIVIISLQAWKLESSNRMMSSLKDLEDSRTWLYIVQGTKREVKKYRRINMVQMPYIENSMKVTNISLEFFENII
ncbi:MAG: hypothetical protein K2M73_06650 [Lachnospiraceae bacterium]|nr:hypothetical protein [Lachnospiraceae bacterium]